MLSASQIKEIRSLHLQKYRNEKGLFLVEGVKMVNELLKSDFQVHGIYGYESWLKEMPGKQFARSPHLSIVSPSELGRISTLKTPNEALAVVKMAEYTIKKTDFDDLVLMLDRISDPGNLGTILRIADWFGIKTMVCSQDTVELYNPKVVQATMGSLFRVKVVYEDISKVLSTFAQTIPKYGALLDGENIYAKALPGKAVIIIGNESHGISQEVRSLVDHPLMIPAMANGAESLNASVAAAVICSEFRRKELRLK
ncbi:MAG: RNA methyltransferase [Bacteroidales bacterium]|nr:RNA methyltransferase [Bacteroidales bacterium]